MLHRVDPFDGSSEVLIGPDPNRLERVLLSTADLPGPRPTIEWVIPSPDGAHLALGLSVDGSEDATVRILDVESGSLLPDSLPHSFLSPAIWLPDGSGFYVRHGDTPFTDGGPQYTVHHVVGGTTTREEGLEGDAMQIVVEPSGDVLLIEGPGTTVTPTRIRRPGSNAWLPLLDRNGSNFIGALHDGGFLCVTNEDADRGRVVSIPLDTAPDCGTWTELVPESDGVLRGVTRLEHHLVTFEIVDGSHRIRVFGADGTFDHTVDIPAVSGLDVLFGFGQANGEPRVFPDGPTSIAFHLGGFDRLPCPMHYDVVTRELTALQHQIRDERIVATLHQTVSADGHPVTYWHIRLSDTRDPAPATVYGYGGFNIAQHTPCHPTPLVPWLERGGCLLLPHLRGGGEQGLAHWRAALDVGKQRTFDDLYAVAQHAATAGLVLPERLGFVGASNGGLTAAAAITQRPDLFRAVICAIPVVDLFDLADRPLGKAITEYGSADIPEHVAAWRRYSPLQQVRDGVEYPAVLVDIGEVDARCPAEPARRFAERLGVAAGKAGRRVVVNERVNGGHVAPEGELWPVWLDFLITELMESDR
jgi:prolyl oligopeptidase